MYSDLRLLKIVPIPSTLYDHYFCILFVLFVCHSGPLLLFIDLNLVQHYTNTQDGICCHRTSVVKEGDFSFFSSFFSLDLKSTLILLWLQCHGLLSHQKKNPNSCQVPVMYLPAWSINAKLDSGSCLM